VLLQTPLQAADGKVYAVAQGPVTVGGFVAGGAAARVTKNVTTTGRIPGGAIVERDVSMDFVQSNWISLLLEEPDFTTAQRIANAITSGMAALRALPMPDAWRLQSRRDILPIQLPLLPRWNSSRLPPMSLAGW